MKSQQSTLRSDLGTAMIRLWEAMGDDRDIENQLVEVDF